jgi:hypothetical protein
MLAPVLVRLGPEMLVLKPSTTIVIWFDHHLLRTFAIPTFDVECAFMIRSAKQVYHQ